MQQFIYLNFCLSIKSIHSCNFLTNICALASNKPSNKVTVAVNVAASAQLKRYRVPIWFDWKSELTEWSKLLKNATVSAFNQAC